MAYLADDTLDLATSGLYLDGWETIASPGSCTNGPHCYCLNTGTCSTPWFYHFMVLLKSQPDAPSSPLQSDASSGILELESDSRYDGGLLLSDDALVTSEEIPISPQTLGHTYYTMEHVLKDHPGYMSLLSLYDGTYKTPFFDMLVRIDIRSKDYTIPEGYSEVLVGPASDELDLYMSLADSTRSKILGLIDDVGLKVLPHSGSTSLLPLFATPACVAPDGGLLSLLDVPPRAGDKSTALVTLNVLMQPVSVYGGSYPATREVVLTIHNVKSVHRNGGYMSELHPWEH